MGGKAFGSVWYPVQTILIRGDSQGALGAIKNYQYTKHTEHIEIVHDFMKDRYQTGQLDFEYVHGNENPADIFTKCLGGPKFEKFRAMMGMAELPSSLRWDVCTCDLGGREGTRCQKQPWRRFKAARTYCRVRASYLGGGRRYPSRL